MAAQPPPSDLSVIRALRNETNAALAARDAARLEAVFSDDIHAVFAGGVLATGREAVVRAYAEQLAPGGRFLRGLRTPGKITVRDDGSEASEPGRWRWTMRTPSGEAALAGDYLAGWRREASGWRLASELYVTTVCRGAGRPL